MDSSSDGRPRRRLPSRVHEAEREGDSDFGAVYDDAQPVNRSQLIDDEVQRLPKQVYGA